MNAAANDVVETRLYKERTAELSLNDLRPQSPRYLKFVSILGTDPFMILGVMAFYFFEFVMHRQSSLFREYEAAFLSLQWMLLACLAVWCGSFLFLTFSVKDWPLIGLLLIAIVAYFIGYAVRPSRDALTLLAGVTLGRGASFALKEDRGWKVEDGRSRLAIRHSRSSILIFLTGLVLLLAFAAWWHLDVLKTSYHGPRWMGLWDNPNTYGMLMGAGGALAIGLLAANAKLKIKNSKTGQPFLRSSHFFAVVKSAIRHPLSAILFIAAGMMVLGLVMSYSRGAWLGTAIGLLYLAWCYRKLKWRHIIIGAGVLALVSGLLWGRTADSAPWYVKRADLGRPSAQHRATAWRAGLEIMRDHPFGVGWNRAVSVYDKSYSPPEGGAAAITTNDYLMLGTELGVAALVCFVSYVALCYRRSPRLDQLKIKNVKLKMGLATRPFDQLKIKNVKLKMGAAGRKSEAGSQRSENGNQESEDWSRVTHHASLRAACLSGALVLIVAFWFDGGLFKLPTAALFWVLLELGSERQKLKTEIIQNAEAIHKSEVRNPRSEIRGPSLETGFTLAELLVVIAIIGVLAGMLLPTLGRARAKAHGIVCLNNHHQLLLAWKMYVDENHETLPNVKQGPYEWVGGYLDFTSKPENWDPNVNLAKSPLWSYCGKNAAIFKCPSDRSTVKTPDGRTLPRVRTMSMLNWVGGRGLDLPMNWSKASGPWRIYRHLSDFVEPGPAGTFVFLDEREDSINDGMFVVDMTGYPNQPMWVVDSPGSYHGGAGGLSFADGHAEMKKWWSKYVLEKPLPGEARPYPTRDPGNKDIAWLQEHATRRQE